MSSTMSLLKFCSLLMFGSGMPTAEKPQARKFFLMSHGPNSSNSSAWENYKEYLRSTSILIPIPPQIYRSLPVVVKRTLFLDLPIYRFDEKTDGAAAIEEVRASQQSERRTSEP